jgi:hypothetical protein
MTVTVARRYQFTATHSLPMLGPPWNEPHSHRYTVEVVAESTRCTDLGEDVLPGFFDTDILDAAWNAIAPRHGADLDVDWPGDSTVESLASDFLAALGAFDLPVIEVTVWEDDNRWGRARR